MSTEQSLKDKTAKGLFWGGLSNGLQQLLNLFFGIFLARLLSPADYGMVGMLTIFSLLATALQESGFTAALTNRKEIKQNDYNAVFWFNIALSGLLYLLLFFAAPYIAAFYHTPELTALARYSFLGFLISSFGIAPNAYMFRNLMVKQKAIAQVTALLCSGCVGVSMAYLGYAYWGIATQNLVYIGINTLLYWCFSKWRPSLSFDFTPIRSMFGFGVKLLLTNVFYHINQNFLSVILGRFYSEREVGYLNQATKWNHLGQYAITSMITGVAQPVLRSVANDADRQVHIFRKMVRFAAFVAFPAMLGLGLVADELITIAITAKWQASAELMQILCIMGAVAPVMGVYQQLIVSKGKSNIYMWNFLILGLTLLITTLFVYPYGIRCMVICYVSINVCWFFVWHYWASKFIHITLVDTLKDVLPYAVIATTAMIATHFLTAPIDNIYMRFAAKIGLAVILYVLSMWATKSVTFKEVLSYLTKNFQH